MLPLAAAGYHVIAPDQRGYGRTTGWDGAYDGDLGSVPHPQSGARRAGPGLGARLSLGRGRGRPRLRLAGRGLVRAAAARRVPLRGADERAVRRPAARCRSTPTANGPRAARPAATSIHADLAALDPPRKHYHWYYSTREADADMRDCPQGIHAFLRAYYHHKSADWKATSRIRSTAWTASELAKLPTYYVMDLDKGMAETVAPEMPSRGRDRRLHVAARGRACASTAPSIARTGFQGGLQWYRCRTSGRFEAELQMFAGRTIDVPVAVHRRQERLGRLSGAGRLEQMQTTRLHADAGLPSGRGRRPLGAAGAAHRCHRPVGQVPCWAKLSRRVGANSQPAQDAPAAW